METEKEKEIKEELQDGWKVIEQTKFKIPQCCREGWASCPHVPKKQKPTKRNIGM